MKSFIPLFACAFALSALTNCSSMPNLADLQTLSEIDDDDDDSENEVRLTSTAQTSVRKHAKKKKASQKATTGAPVEECKAAIDNLHRIEMKEDGEASDEQALAKRRQTDDYKSDLDECTRLYPPSLITCLIQAKSERQIEACEQKAESRPAEDRPTDEECQQAIDNLFYYELKDDLGAKQAKQMLKQARGGFEYKAAIKECKDELNKTAVRCMINAKSEDEVDACTD